MLKMPHSLALPYGERGWRHHFEADLAAMTSSRVAHQRVSAAHGGVRGCRSAKEVGAGRIGTSMRGVDGWEVCTAE